MQASSHAKVTTNGCTMTANTARNGGAVFATNGFSVVNLTACAMLSNSANDGGAIQATEDSTVVVEDCTMLSNSVYVGDTDSRPRLSNHN